MSDLKKQIKAMEVAQRELQPVAIVVDEVVSFDHWWVVLNRRMVLRPHLKEIIWADFNARGIKKVDLTAKYEEGLKLFGL
jgi:hypothetical protein